MSDESDTSPSAGAGAPDNKMSGNREATRQGLLALLKAGSLRRFPHWIQPEEQEEDKGKDFEQNAADKAPAGKLEQAPAEAGVPLERESAEETRTVEQENGALIELNGLGLPVRTRDAKGEERRFGWNDRGELQEVILPFGRWSTNDGKIWTNQQGKSKSGVRKVDGDGTYWEEDDTWRKLYKLDGTQVEVHKPGAGMSLLFKDGTTLSQHQDKGTVRQIRNKDGSEYQYQVTEDGRMRPLFHKYAKPTRIEFGTPDGVKVVEDICEVCFDWQEEESTVRISYRAGSGTVYILERGRHGEFKSFSQGN